MRARCLLIVVLISTAVVGAAAQPLRFERISVDQGLSSEWIRAILQDRQGFLWIGTQEGLNRYDGYGFEVFRYLPGEARSLSENLVMSLLEDREGRLWVGTMDGLNRFDPASRSFTRYDVQHGLSHTAIRVIYEDRAGTLWVGTTGGLHRWSPETESFVAYRAAAGRDGRLAGRSVTAILEDRRGKLLIGTQEAGLAVLDRTTGTYAPLASADRMRRAGVGEHISVLHEDRDGHLWLATRAGWATRDGVGLHRFEPETGAFRTFHFSSRELRDVPVQISAILENDDGTFWVTAFGAPTGGLHLFDPQAGSFARHTYDPQNTWSLSWGYVTAVFRDRTGLLWVGTSRGLNKLDAGRTKFGHFKEFPNDPYDLRDNVYSILEDDEGVLWLGIDGPGGLVELDRKSGTVTRHVITEAGNDAPGSAGSVFAIAADHGGGLWLGGPSGLHHLDRQTRRFRSYHHVESDPRSLPYDFVTSVLPTRDGQLWVGTQDGLGRLDIASGTFHVLRHDPADARSLSGSRIRSLLEDRNGQIWIGTGPHVNDVSGVGAEGLNRLDPATGEVTRFRHDAADPSSLSNNGVNVIFEDASGTTWVGTDNGLNRYDPKTDGFHHFLDGLPSTRVSGILQDASGHLWVSTRGGLTRFDPQTETFRSFALEDGLQNRRFNDGAAFRSPSGELFFGGVSGVNYFSPDQVTENIEIPPVALTAFRLRDGRAPQVDLATIQEIVLPFRENAFSVEFAALSFRLPEKNRYAYMLEGLDRHWVQAGNRRFASYTNLKPGRYTFMVRAANNDGIWNEEGVSVRVRVLPPWWHTWWAYSLYGLAFAGGVFGVDRHQRRRLVQKERERARERELEQKREIERAYEELKRTQAQLVQQEKLASLGALTAGIAHEIKNPLNFVNNFSSLSNELIEELRTEIDRVEAKLTEEELTAVGSLLSDLRVNLTKIAEHGRRADGIVRSMLEHSRGGSGERQRVELNRFVEEYVNLAYHGKRAQLPGFEVAITQDLAPDAGEVVVAPQDIGRVLLNLVGNAFDAVAERANTSGGDGYSPLVRVQTERQESAVVIRVADNGPGIPEELRARIFEPFFTTKPAGSGTGLGLSLSHEIVTQGHGGSLTVESKPGQGAAFTIALPANDHKPREGGRAP